MTTINDLPYDNDDEKNHHDSDYHQNCDNDYVYNNGNDDDK